MAKSIQLKNRNNEKYYPNPYFPVGSIYLSVVDTNPSTWFGGTWEKIAKGRTLVGVDTNDTDFNTVKKTGGEKTHTLTINEIPSHNHEQYTSANDGGSAIRRDWSSDGNSSIYPQGCCTGYRGGNQAHNNVQPYFTCYIWCRTA